MLLIRLIGGIFIALALLALAFDAMMALMVGGGFRFEALGEIWYQWAPATLNMLQAGVQRNLAPWIWDDVLQNLLLQPAAPLLATAGMLVYMLGALFTRHPSSVRR